MFYVVLMEFFKLFVNCVDVLFNKWKIYLLKFCNCFIFIKSVRFKKMNKLYLILESLY